MLDKGLELLEKLTQAHAVSGFEEEVAEIFKEELKEQGTLGADRSGCLYLEKSQGRGPRVLIAGHMDEVGFRVQSVLANGFLRLVAVGGWWGHSLLSQRLEVKTDGGDKLTGVVCSRPPHFLSESQRAQVLGVGDMYLDIGARSSREVEDWGVKLGDPVAPVSPWTPMRQEGWIMTKAFDNRVGMAGAIQCGLAEAPEDCDLIVAGTVQEEVGLRGATTLANHLKPDVAIILEGPPADDLPGMPLQEAQGRLEGGVQIRLHDPSAIMNPRLARYAIKLAEEKMIRHQVTVRTSGGTDAGSFHLANDGIPSIVLGTPARYIHSHNAIICMRDYEAMVSLALEMARNFTEEVVSELTSFI